MAPDVAACRLSIGYPVEPVSATRAYAAWARVSGVDIREGAAARPHVIDERVRGVLLDDGRTIDAPEVVVAAGPWTPALVDPTTRWRPISALWGVVVAIALAEPPRHVLEEAEIDIEPVDPIEPGATLDGAAAGDRAFSLVTAAGSSSLGSTFLADQPDAPRLVDDIVARGARFVPAIAAARQGAVRACARPLSVDGRPLVGRIPWVDGLWVVAGHGPWGISTGPATGRLLADLLTGTQAAPPAALDPARFGTRPGP